MCVSFDFSAAVSRCLLYHKILFSFSFSRLSYFASVCCFVLNVVSVRSFCLAVAGLVLVRDLIGY